MSKKKTTTPGEGVTIPEADYRHMVEVMDELAFRGPDQEALMMRVAKAGGISEVMTAIKRRRIYAKKRDDATRGTQPKPQGKKGKRGKRGAGTNLAGPQEGAA